MKNTKKNQEKWVEKVRENLLLRGRSDQTFLNYKCALNRFFNYYNKEIDIDKLKEEDIVSYLRERIIDKNMCTDTYNLNVAAIKLFYSICFNKSLNKLLIPSCKNKKRIPTILDKKTFIKIFNEENHIKYKCWLLLAFCSGLRVEEVATLRIENIFPNEHKLKVLGKGNKERFTILPDVVTKFLRLYCKEKHITKKNGYLFEGTNSNEHINSKGIINYFSAVKVKYNLEENISYHSLRHSFATYYLSNGGSLLTLQSMLGHTNINTTTIYLHLSQNFNELEGINYAK